MVAERANRGDRSGSSARRLWRATASWLGCLIVGVALVELLLRGWAYHFRETFERYDYATGVYRLVPGRHPVAEGGAVTINRDGFRGPELRDPSPALYRIVTVGDSCTFGGGGDENIYPVMLQQALDARSSEGLRYEVVNAAISGADSEDALRRLVSKVLPLEPDVVTIYIGWNDLMKRSPSAQAGNEALSYVSRSLNRLWLARALRKLFYFSIRPLLFDPETGPGSRTGRFDRFAPRIFEENLAEMTRAISLAGARPVLVTLPTGLREDTSLARIRERQIGFPFFRDADRVGDFLDLIDSYNRAIQRVAIENDTPVIDLAAAFAQLPRPASYFWDTMHHNRNGQALVAGMFESVLHRRGLLTPSPSALDGASFEGDVGAPRGMRIGLR